MEPRATFADWCYHIGYHLPCCLLTGEKPRSPHWPAVRRQHLLYQPSCQATGDYCDVEVHHIQPFDTHPELELVAWNLITLRRDAHFVIGHRRNWCLYNPAVVADAAAHLHGLDPSSPLK